MKGNVDIPSCSVSGLERARKMKSKNQNHKPELRGMGKFKMEPESFGSSMSDDYSPNKPKVFCDTEPVTPTLITKSSGSSNIVLPEDWDDIRGSKSKNQDEICECGHEIEYHRFTDLDEGKCLKTNCLCTHFIPKKENHKPRNAISPDFIGDNPDTMKEGTICPLETPSGENHIKEITEKMKDLIGERNFARKEKSWGIARDLTKEIKKLRKMLK